MTKFLENINAFVWGAPALVLILGVGLYLTVGTGFAQLTLLPRAVKLFFLRLTRREGEDESSFRCLCTALAATVGTGNLAGVAGALCLGGPGAVFWMWVCALLGLFGDLTNIYTILLLISTVWFFFLGFTDDYIKVFKKNKEGLSEKKKLVGQGAMALAIGLAVCFSDQIVVREDVDASESTETVAQRQDLIKSTATTIPFVKDHEFDYKWLSPFKGTLGWYCKWAIYVLMIVIVITACSNGVNLTDGMDGLAAGTTAIVGVVLGLFAWFGGNIVNADYLNIMYIPDSGEVAVFMSALVGALIGFLWYNTYPAQVFMGDTGSLMLGGIIGVTAVLIRKELLIPILCGIFFAESVSVIMQRTYFKYTKKKYGEGRRVFKMAPLHHHYQKEGIPSLIQKPAGALPEAKIVSRFWIVGIILAVVTVALLKVR